jgi:MYXO-CTERM domain-containing protein
LANRVLLGALLALALAMHAMAEEDTGYAGPSVDLTLFAHIYDLLDTLPMNAQPMPPETPDLARGYSPEPTVAPQYGAAFNRLRFFNSMGPVEYNNSIAQPRIHPEKGLALDLELDTSKDVLLYWYMSADALEVQRLGEEPPVHAGAVPHLTVRAELRLGNDLRSDLAAGDLIAGGEATVDVVTAPGAPDAQEIIVNLGKPQLDVIPAREGFNLGVEWFQLEASGEQVLAPGWNLHTGGAWPNRVVLPVANPIYLYFVEPQFQGDRVAVNAAFNSPLGNYDVDTSTLHLEVAGPGGFAAKALSEPVVVQQTFAHNEHHVAALQGWLWDYKADGAPPGNYTVKVHGSNLQHTATAEKAATFTIADEGKAGVALDSEGSEVVTKQQLEDQKPAAKKSPGAEAGLALALLGLLALARRRQGS